MKAGVLQSVPFSPHILIDSKQAAHKSILSLGTFVGQYLAPDPVFSQNMHTPHGSCNNQRTHGLMRHGQHNVDVRHHGCDSENHLRAEGCMDSNRGFTGMASYPPCEHDEEGNRDPCPPAMDIVDQVMVIVERGPDAC